VLRLRCCATAHANAHAITMIKSIKVKPKINNKPTLTIIM